MSTYKAVLLKDRPTGGPITEALFDVVTRDIPSAGAGEIVIRQTHMSLDPAMFGWMSPDTDSYIPPVALGEVMRSSGFGEVVESQHDGFAVGDKVMGMFGWTEYLLSNGQGVNKVDANVNGEMALSIFGLPGLTATQGLFNVGEPKAGETLIVTGAAGSVGSLVGQLAKAEGLRVIGVAGSDEKCDWIVNELGFDGAINYKSDSLVEQLAELTPDGIDVFFENTGGPIQSMIFDRMNAHGRIIVCGLIADYAAKTPLAGPSWIRVIKKRLRIEGFTMPDHLHETPQLLQTLTPYVLEGKVKYRAHVLDGLEAGITGLNLFFTGGNTGKLMVKL